MNKQCFLPYKLISSSWQCGKFIRRYHISGIDCQNAWDLLNSGESEYWLTDSVLSTWDPYGPYWIFEVTEIRRVEFKHVIFDDFSERFESFSDQIAMRLLVLQAREILARASLR